MILKYGNFLLERLLLESNVIYSDKFKKVLTKMTDNTIAKQLLDMENKDLDVLSKFEVISVTAENGDQDDAYYKETFLSKSGGGWIELSNPNLEWITFLTKEESRNLKLKDLGI
jgi:hypothetical protein